jgi:hypothetical protein
MFCLSPVYHSRAVCECELPHLHHKRYCVSLSGERLPFLMSINYGPRNTIKQQTYELLFKVGAAKAADQPSGAALARWA